MEYIIIEQKLNKRNYMIKNDPHSYEHKLIQDYHKIQPVTLCYTVVVQVAFYIINTVSCCS